MNRLEPGVSFRPACAGLHSTPGYRSLNPSGSAERLRHCATSFPVLHPTHRRQRRAQNLERLGPASVSDYVGYMRVDRFTQKMQEALQSAQDIASEASPSGDHQRALPARASGAAGWRRPAAAREARRRRARPRGPAAGGPRETPPRERRRAASSTSARNCAPCSTPPRSR